MQKQSTNMLLNIIAGLLMIFLHLSSFAIGILRNDGCDLFSGEWIPSTSAPRYRNTSCAFMSDPRNCMKNGRPDKGYLFWKWKPYGCDLRRHDLKRFLNAMQGKSLAMIGDSLLLNQMQSLLCLLSQEEKSIKTYHSKGFTYRRWHFRSYNFTLATYWAPFLLDAHFISQRKVKLYLDRLESRWTSEYHEHSYVVIAAGPWFNTSMIITENNTIVGCHFCKGEYKELDAYYLYRKALQTALTFITKSDHKPLVLFRTWSPKHFEFGEWYNTGVCNRTAPYERGRYNGTTVEQKYYSIDADEFNKADVFGSKRGVRLKFLDIYRLSLLRPDGHPGPYMKFHPFEHKHKDARVQNDCVHWCLPGPIDTWNELMVEMLLNEPQTSLKGIS